jgi:peptidylprolyl isomerase
MYHKRIMKLTSAALILAAATAPVAAQTTATHPAARPAGATAARPAAAAACAKPIDLSPKIPALPPGPCVKHLYTITTVPSVKLDYISPMEGPGLKADLGLEPTTFSLDYVDTKVGTGELAGAHTWYTINYTGYLPDGTKFDSSLDHGEPITIHYGEHQVIAGWDTGFAGMRIGGKRRLIIPFQLGYGTAGKGPIPAKSTLIFDVELLAISATQPPPKTPPTPPAPPANSTPKPATPPPATPPPATPPPTTPPPTPPPAK